MNRIKHALLGALAAPGTRTAFRPCRRGIGTIFMLHRFADPETGIRGHDPAELRQTLGFLRRRGYEFVDLGELFRRLQEAGRPDDLGVAFTLDDGYAEQVRVAGPAFAEFDCPATVFVATGFLDRKLWFWWDRIEYVFEHAPRGDAATTIGGERIAYRWDRVEGPGRACRDFTARCKRVSDQEKHTAIAELAAQAGVALPAEAPPRYAPMTWNELRTWEQRGITFGPHTVTHPILAQVPDAQSQQELAGSWQRLCEEARRPVPVFCYPNGQDGDFGAREFSELGDLGLQGAVVGIPGYADASEFRARAEHAYTVRRFGYPDDYRLVSKYVSGFERLLHGTGATS